MGNKCKTSIRILFTIRDYIVGVYDMIIGQVSLLSKIDKLIESFPKFSIIVGSKGSGKKTIAKYICERLNLPIIKVGTKIDDIREMIDLSYEQFEPMCYLIADADNMSIGAKNSLLKITEEPPKNAYFIMTLESMSNTLETIQSRGTVLPLDNYSKEELIQYREMRKYSNSFDDLIIDSCSSTGDVDELFCYDIPSFKALVNNIIDYIHGVPVCNTFKIPKSIKTKADDKEGFNSILLLNAVRNGYIKRGIQTRNPNYLRAALITSQYIRDLRLGNVNKIGTMDMWIMDIRKLLNVEAEGLKTQGK